MNNLVEVKQVNIEDLIYEIRGKQVMLDSDLAKLYNCVNGTKEINQAVKNNVEKFPERFSWRLTDDESSFLVKCFDQKRETRGGKYKNPRVFTEQGVCMLATIIKSKVATTVSINIIDAFVNMRKYIKTDLIEQKYINNLVLKHDLKINEILDKLNNTVNNHIFFKGQIYEAYSLLLDIINRSKQEIIIIDNYADKKLLDILSKTEKEIVIYTKNIDEELIKKYTAQYNNVKIIKKDNIHDRFIIIDQRILYHSGASFKDLGKSCFAINEIEDKSILKELINYLEK